MHRCSLDRGWPKLAGFTALAALALSPVDKAAAAAWPRARNQHLLVLPVEYSTADRQFDEDGDKIDRLKFQQVQISPYFEYGLTDSLTIGAQPRFIWVQHANEFGGDDINTGLADIDIFARLRLWGRGAAALSVRGLAKAPIEADETEAAPLGFDQADIEGSLLYTNAYSDRISDATRGKPRRPIVSAIASRSSPEASRPFPAAMSAFLTAGSYRRSSVSILR